MPPGRRPTPPRPRGATGFQPAKNRSTSGQDAYGQRYAAQADFYGTDATRAAMAEYGNAGPQVLGPGANDPYGDINPMQAFMEMFGPQGVYGPGGAGGGSGRGGGGGAAAKPGDPDPLGWNAIAQQQALEKGYAEMLAAQDAKAAAIGAGFDARNASLTGARDQGAAQLQALLADLQNRSTGASQAVAGTYAQGDQALQGLESQYAQMVAGRQPAMAQTLTAFGAAPGAAVSDPSGVQNMLMAQRANLARVGQADQALLGNRQNVYNGLNSDVSTQRQMQFDGLMAKLLADRQVADQQSATDRANLAMQQQQAILQLQQQEQARRASYG